MRVFYSGDPCSRCGHEESWHVELRSGAGFACQGPCYEGCDKECQRYSNDRAGHTVSEVKTEGSHG